ncbi:phage portal protein [Candidatus Saccharibacteria bacterium]|nr:phage portal protein [Candidatus Saccharibacteria bacterium]
MGIRQRISDAISGNRRRTRATQETNNVISVNALCSAYENLFAQVRPLIDEMKTVIPYGVGRNGGSLGVARTPELAALQDPNEDMGWGEFADAMFATWLTETELNIHVHKTPRGKVYGYSVLPPGCRTTRAGGEVIFEFYDEKGGMVTLTRDEVATLRFSRSPRNIDKGVSPASSVFTWSQIDDLMAQYQKAFLENGAVPASLTIIRASSKDKFEQARKEMEKQYRGAENRNKTLYIWRQFDNDDGTEKDQVEIKTIQGNNSTLAIKELISVVNDRLNKAVGVSNFILGDDSSAKYDNAELSDLQFTKRRVYPALVSFWGQFQHELDRIVGGLGYAIQFDLDVPELTDRLKTKAETSQKNADTLINLIKAGARPSAAVEALGLSQAWLPVANGIFKSVLPTDTTINPTPILNKNSSLLTPNQSQHSETKTEDKKEIVGSTTKDAAIGYPVFNETEIREKSIYDSLMKIAEAYAKEFQVSVQDAIDAIMEVLVPEADDGANAGAERIGKITDGEASDFIQAQLDKNGFHVSEDFQKDLNDRVADLVSNYDKATAERLQNILSSSQEEGLSASEIKKRVREVLPKEMAERAALIARNETVHAFRAGRLSNDEYLANRFGLKLGKIWRCKHDKETCEVCEAMDGRMVELKQAFPDEIEDKDGNVLKWDHTVYNHSGETPDAHVNCRCYFDEVILDD